MIIVGTHILMPKFGKRVSAKRHNRFENANAAKEAGQNPEQVAARVVNSANPSESRQPQYVPTTTQQPIPQQQQAPVENAQKEAYQQQINQALGPVEKTGARGDKSVPTSYINPQGAVPLLYEGRGGRFGGGGGQHTTPRGGRFQKKPLDDEPVPQHSNTTDSDVTVVNYSTDLLSLTAIHDSQGKVQKQIKPKSVESFIVPIGTVMSVVRTFDKQMLYKQRISDGATTLAVAQPSDPKIRTVMMYVAGIIALVLVGIGLYFLFQ